MNEPEIPSARLLAPGTRFGGKYVLVRRLATGGMGDVWLAQNGTTQASVALKVLRPNTASKMEAEERFRREARLAGLLEHRSIVRIFDFLEEPDGTLVLVMELLRGETLERWLARKKILPEREAMAVMTAVLSALQHGHEQGIVHRDVKPSNIFLAVESDGRVIPKLLDYGIAKMPKNDSKTMDGVVLGTPSYMSPEQIRSEGDLDGRSDLFSCGVVMVEMMTGTGPFDAPTPAAAIAAVLQNAVDPDPRIPPRLWLELQRALSKRPKQRHASAAEMRTAMLDVLGETEDSLASALSGVNPRDYGADRTGPVAVAAAALAREAETQSVEGQSVATLIPPLRPKRRVAAWLPWAAGGAVVGSIAMVVAMTREGRIGPGVASPAEAAAILAAPSAPDSAGLSSAIPADVASAPPPLAVNPLPAAVPLAVHSPSSASAGAAKPVKSHASPPKPHAPPKPVATSPGF